MRIDVRANVAEAKRDLAKLEANIRQRAIARALNRTIDQGRTQMAREISSEFNIKQAEVRVAVSTRRAREGAGGLLLEASLEAFGSRRGRGFNVTRFRVGAVPRATKRKGRGQLKFRIKRGSATVEIPGAFVLNKPGSPVVRRVGRERFPLAGVSTIGIPQMFNTRRINARVVRFLQEKFPEVLKREIDYYVGRFGR